MALIRRIFAALEATFEGTVRWRGGDIDRLLDERHAGVIEAVAGLLPGDGWEVDPDVTYSEYGERGSIDLLALREADKAVAVFEIKIDLTSVEGTIRKHGEKARLAPAIVAKQRGWRPRAVARILVIAEDRTARRIVARHEATFRAAYPASSRDVRRWLSHPDGELSGIWFLTPKRAGSGSRVGGGPRRVRTSRPPCNRA